MFEIESTFSPLLKKFKRLFWLNRANRIAEILMSPSFFLILNSFGIRYEISKRSESPHLGADLKRPM